MDFPTCTTTTPDLSGRDDREHARTCSLGVAIDEDRNYLRNNQAARKSMSFDRINRIFCFMKNGEDEPVQSRKESSCMTSSSNLLPKNPLTFDSTRTSKRFFNIGKFQKLFRKSVDACVFYTNNYWPLILTILMQLATTASVINSGNLTTTASILIVIFYVGTALLAAFLCQSSTPKNLNRETPLILNSSRNDVEIIQEPKNYCLQKDQNLSSSYGCFSDNKSGFGYTTTTGCTSATSLVETIKQNNNYALLKDIQSNKQKNYRTAVSLPEARNQTKTKIQNVNSPETSKFSRQNNQTVPNRQTIIQSRSSNGQKILDRVVITCDQAVQTDILGTTCAVEEMIQHQQNQQIKNEKIDKPCDHQNPRIVKIVSQHGTIALSCPIIKIDHVN